MKLSRRMRQNLNLVPDDGESAESGMSVIHYPSQMDPLVKRGLVTYEERMVPVMLPRVFARLTDLGRRVKHQNTDD